ncbi:MAG: hypothetical protein IPP68_11540 [Elusimicrobia bacterium]|nr:hypothetical protein [Elusimicrobiota bacterium]
MKSIILSEGYERVTREDYPYKGAFVTQYSKKNYTGKGEFETRIYLNFRADAPNSYYRNFGLLVHGAEYKSTPEIDTEINRMELLLYEKLVEVSGKENVKRGKKEIYGRGSILEAYQKKGKEVPKVVVWKLPKVKRGLTTEWIPRDQMPVVKGAILGEGYQRTGDENVLYEDHNIVTEYAKDIPAAEKTRHVRIKLSFQETYAPRDYYGDLSITLLNFERSDIPEVNAEVGRMEKILHKKLAEVSGEENVKVE